MTEFEYEVPTRHKSKKPRGTPTSIPAFAAGVIDFDVFELGDAVPGVTTGKPAVRTGPVLLVPKGVAGVREYDNETPAAVFFISVSAYLSARKVVIHLHKYS